MTRLRPISQLLLVALLLVLSFALLSQYFSSAKSAAVQDSGPSGQQQIATQRTAPNALQGAAAVEQLKQRGLYVSLNEAVTGARYAMKPVGEEQRSVVGAKYVADNPAQHLQTNFAAAGPELKFAGQGGKAWRLGMKLRSVGYGERQIEVGAGTLTAQGQRTEYQRPNAAMPNASLEFASLPVFKSAIGNRQSAITEWYINKPTGLEQGFTLAEQPSERQALQPLRLTLELESALRARAVAAGQAVEFVNAAGNIVLRYDHLVVRDACGQELAARMSVKGKELHLDVEDAAAIYPVTIDPNFTQQAYLKASNTEATDFFGAAVAMSGDTVVVGAYLEDSNATGVNGNQADNSATAAGAAYVFVRSGTTWSQQAYLKASNPGASDQFGFSVAVAGNTVVVGANTEDSNAIGVNGNQADNSATNSGAVYVFVRSGTTWSQQAYLKASNTESGDNFGVSVGTTGDTVVVGANGEDSNATGVNGNQADNSASISGAAYVFVRSGTTWSQQAYLKASNTDASDQLGAWVAVAGDTVVIGAIGEDSNTTGVNGNQADNSASSAGAAYVFVRSGGTWSQQAYLKASNSGASDQFGVSVAVAGDTVVVGAVLEDSSATGVDGNQADNSASASGAAYVFVRSGTTWSQQAYLKASNTGAIDEFGVAVAVAGDTVVVGSHAEDSNATGVNGNQADNSAIDSGAAYIFVRSGTTWSQSAYLKGSNGEAGDNFGVSIAVDGDTVVVGAFVEDSNATGVNGNQADNSALNSGAVYVISVPRTFVTNGNDSGPGSLRQAILDTPVGGTIDFDPTFFSTARTITLNGTALDINQNLTILGPGANLLTISGNNQSRVFQISSGLTVSLSGMTITGGNPGGLPGGGIRSGGSNLTVSACDITGNTADDGGGILSDGPLTILNSTVSNNLATLTSNAAGGVSAQSTLTVTNSTISGNYATIGINNGGGIWVNGNATITNSTITNNATGANGGGGVFRNGGTTTILNTIIAGNLNNSNVADVSAAGNIGITSSGYNLIGNPGALTFGGTGDQNGTSGTPLNPQLGPLSLNGGPTPTHAPLGGSPALDKGNATGLDQRGLTRQFNIASIVLAPGGNESDIGAVEMQALIVTTESDPGDGVCDGTCTLRDALTAANANGAGLDDIIFSNTVGPTINLLSALPNITSSVSLNGPGANLLRVRRNVTPEFRIFTIANTGLKIAISGMTISDGLRTSSTGDGGVGSGIFSQSNLTLTNVAVTNNSSRIGLGGGVALANADGLFTNCTFSANTAGDTTTGGRGGGIFFEGDNGHKLRLVNSTVSGNNSIKSDFFSGLGLGGGIFNLTANGNSILEVVNSTIANNTAFADGGIHTETAGSGTSQTTLRNSIVANNTANNLAAGGAATISSQGFNLTSDNSNTFLNRATDKTNTNPLLGALANNGGPTQTHGLLTGSPALDAGHSSGATTDQRGLGFARLVDLTGVNNIGDGADIGAYEAQSVPSVIQFSAANYNAGEAAGNVTITVTRTGSTLAASMVDFATGNNGYVPCNQFTGSAVQNCDFIGTSGTLTFAAGDSSKTFEVLVTDDAWLEGNETIPITLSNPVGATVGSTAGATVTILDNELGGITSPVAKQFVANLTGGQETPANNSTAKGGGVVLLNTAETGAQVSLLFSGLSSAQTTAKIHGPGNVGVAAPPIFTLANGTVTNAVINPTSQQVTDLKAGLHYLNVSSANFTNGEIRGQLLWNPLEETPFFVLQHYYDFLQRLPDAGGYSFWQSLITQCGSDVQCLRDRRLLVSNAFFYEQEYQQTGAYVFRLYRAAYGNHQPFPNPDNSNPTESLKLPSYAVFAADRARVVGGASLAQGQADLASTFVTRPEFVAKYAANLTGPQFVGAVLATLQTELGVNLETERTNLINLFNSGGRGAVMYRLADDNAQNPISNSTFIDEEYNRAFVATQYFGYLRRDADIGGFLFWLGQVNSGPLRDVNKQHAMVCSFNTAGEYQLRFGPVITRFNSECQ